MNTSKVKKQVKCIETKQVFESISEAAYIFEVSRSNLGHAIHQDRKIRNLTFKFINKQHKLKETPKHYTKLGTPIKCNETGEVFTSQAEACRKYNIHFINMNHHLRKWKNPVTKKMQIPSCGGLTFKYIKRKQ